MEALHVWVLLKSAFLFLREKFRSNIYVPAFYCSPKTKYSYVDKNKFLILLCVEIHLTLWTVLNNFHKLEL